MLANGLELLGVSAPEAM
ncbi:MAG: hypothetical protein LC715_08755 [Gammaproteobacteria bacterium]|nr:hypothetical protein [Gammaproteobacteria bacterium]